MYALYVCVGSNKDYNPGYLVGCRVLYWTEISPCWILILASVAMLAYYPSTQEYIVYSEYTLVKYIIDDHPHMKYVQSTPHALLQTYLGVLSQRHAFCHIY